jgi:hypothetical protein
MTDIRQRHRLARLRDELTDEGMPLSLPGTAGDALLEEIEYATHPLLHEGVAPRYGAIVSVPRASAHDDLVSSSLRSTDAADPATLRRLADGRLSFVHRSLDGASRLVVFSHNVEYEASAVRLSDEHDVYVVQRSAVGRVRVCGPDGVVVWEGSRWWLKPLASRLGASVLQVVDEANPDVVAGLSELAVHWLSAGRVGATLVMALDDDAEVGHLGLDAAITIPPLDVTCRLHFAPLLSLLAQIDRASVVRANGEIDMVGVALRSSRETARAVGAYRGTRHTAARRFSYDERRTIVFVVSSAGPVSVFHAGSLVSAATSVSGTDVEAGDEDVLTPRTT